MQFILSARYNKNGFKEVEDIAQEMILDSDSDTHILEDKICISYY
jgi:hypothetical protein